MSLIEAKAVWKRTDCSVTCLMISYLLVVEQHRTQIVIHALLKCQQENLYHEHFKRAWITDRKSGSAGMPRPISYDVFCLKKKTTSSATQLRSSLRTPRSYQARID